MQPGISGEVLQNFRVPQTNCSSAPPLLAPSLYLPASSAVTTAVQQKVLSKCVREVEGRRRQRQCEVECAQGLVCGIFGHLCVCIAHMCIM